MKVSVIIPVYNAASYIAETLQSLQHQTMQDFEVLLVDDHGTDNSMAVAREITGEDSRFRYLATPVNSGPGVARNVGIAEAKGEFIAFLDSDDLWEPTFLEALIQPSEQFAQPLDLTYCQLKYRGGSRDGEEHRNPVMKTGVFTGNDRKYFLRHFVTFSVCFLYRKQFLLDNALSFPERRNSEDTNFLIKCLLLAETIACVDTPLYIYNVREESLTTGHNPQRYRERISSLNALMKDFCAMKASPKYKSRHLGQYHLEMLIIWLKKGLAQALLEFFR